MILNFAELVSIIKNKKKQIDRIINEDWQEFGQNALLILYDDIEVHYIDDDIFIKITHDSEVQDINIRRNIARSACGGEDHFIRYVSDSEVIYFRSEFLKTTINICKYCPHSGLNSMFKVEIDKDLLSINKHVDNYDYYLHSFILKDECWSKYTLEIVDIVLPIGKNVDSIHNQEVINKLRNLVNIVYMKAIQWDIEGYIFIRMIEPD